MVHGVMSLSSTMVLVAIQKDATQKAGRRYELGFGTSNKLTACTALALP